MASPGAGLEDAVYGYSTGASASASSSSAMPAGIEYGDAIEAGAFPADINNGTLAVAEPTTLSQVGSVPFDPPEAVKKWLRKEDWDALTKAWEEAEAQAIQWAEGEDWDEDLWEDEEDTPSTLSTSTLGKTGRRPVWDEAFSMLGQDKGKPAPLRRYFDSLPSERSPWCPPPGQRQYAANKKAPFYDPEESPLGFNQRGQRVWCSTFSQNCSSDNDLLHPHLRHYFDRRGIESSYRQRPHVDKVAPYLRPRTPLRPTTRELVLRHSVSEPDVRGKDAHDTMSAQSRGIGDITWSRRALLHGQDYKLRRPGEILEKTEQGSAKHPVPWVADHHISVSDDNSSLNPMLRHYFDAEGLESSYKNRGHHHGRAKRRVFGKIPKLRKSHSTSTFEGASQSTIDSAFRSLP